MHNFINAALAAIICLTALLGQSGGGRITGRVTDMTGRPMGDVSLRLESGGTTAATARTAADGTFTVDNVAPGTYSVFLQSTGQTWRNPTPLTVAAGSSSIEVSFSQGDRSEDTLDEIKIRAGAPTIQTDSSEVSRAYETRIVRSLPLQDRQNQDLIALMPGVTPAVVNQDRVEDPQRRRTFNVNGLPAWANAYYQDGSYQTEMFNNKPARISPNEAVQQLNIVTSNFNGEHGFAGGSWTNIVTRPGTNGFHGSVFGLYTGSFLTTRNPLNTNAGDPGFNQNQFGGSVSGPIVPNKTFVFGGYEGLIRRGDTLQIASIPPSDLRAGDFSQFGSAVIFNPATGNTAGTGRLPFANNVLPNTAINPAARAILGFLPAANQTGLVNNLVGNARLLEDLHRFDTKLDHRFSDKSTGFFRYGFTHSSVNRGSILGVLGDPAQAELRNHSATASYTHSFTNSVAGEFRVGYARFRNQIGPWGDFTELNNTLGGLGFDNLPQINIAGFGTFGFAGNIPSKPVNNNFDFATNWTWHNGMHNLKLGAQIVRNRADGFDAGPFSPRGTFFFGSGATALSGGNASQVNLAANSFAGFLTGAPTTSGVSSFLQTPTYRQTLTSAFVTDTINLWRKLYLELGVRYDVYSPLETRTAGGALLYDPVTNQVQAVGRGGINMFGNVDYDLNNIAPRVGLVFRPVSRLAFRAGYGIHYFPVPILYSAINQAALGVQQGIVGGFGTTLFRVPTPVTLTGATAANQPFNVGPTDPQTPYVQTYSAMVQADMGNGFLLDVGYSGNVGRQMPFSRALNVAQPGTGLAGLPFASFNRFASTNFRGTGLNSNYNSLQVNLTKRFAAGLALAGAYTFGKALDYGFEQANPFNTASNYGVADWDRKHILSISHLWQLPFGAGSPYLNSGWAGAILGSWELNGILHWATGTPYSVTADPIACACPGLLAQPAAFSGNAASFNGQIAFDSALFSVPPAGTFGSLGRNSFRGPELFSYDLSVFRAFPIRESLKFELRAEAYNLTNTTNYLNPVSTLGSPAFGRPTQTFNGAGGRQFQLGGRFLF